MAPCTHPRPRPRAARALALAVGGGAIVGGLAACAGDADPRQAFVGDFTFVSGSFETDCAPIPEGHTQPPALVELALDDDARLALTVDGTTLACDDEAELAAAPRRLGCELFGGSVSLQAEVWIDLSYERPNRLRLEKQFAAPAACFMRFGGELSAAP